MGEYTVFNLLADIISLLLAAQEGMSGQRLMSPGSGQLSADMERFGGYLRKLAEALSRGIQLPPQLYCRICADAEQCIHQGDYEGARILVKVLETEIGDFRNYYNRMKYSGGAWKSVIQIPPLNTNYKIVNVKIYPAAAVDWMRCSGTETLLERYVAVTPDMETMESIRCIYVRKGSIQNVLEEKHGLDIAVSPVCSSSTINVVADAATEVTWAADEQNVMEKRIVRIAEAALKHGCDIIAFPLATVEPRTVIQLQNLLESYAEKAVLLLSPMYYEDCRKKVKVLGKSGRVLYESGQYGDAGEQALLLVDRLCGLLVPVQTQKRQCMCLNTGAGEFLAELFSRPEEWKNWSQEAACSGICEACTRDLCYYEISVLKMEGSFRYECNYRTA